VVFQSRWSYRKYVKGKTYEATQRGWFKLRDEASRGPVTADVPKQGFVKVAGPV
jgi:hypothetical protein